MLLDLMEVILYVQDMGAQVRFYRDILGLEVSYPAGLTDYTGQMWVTFATGACTLALHGGATGARGKDAPKIVFRVADIETARGLLCERGVDMRDIREAAPGVLTADGFDPEGNAFSIEAHVGGAG
jgi:predicted enzyme related to lactoylglutathione lyase